MKTRSILSFGDRVRVVSTPITVELGLAGLLGQIYGETTPSVTNVRVIGDLTEDYAVNVHFAEKGGEFWFVAHLLEFIDHAPGTSITIGEGVSAKSFTRSSTGEWVTLIPSALKGKKSWWKFW